VFGVIYSLDEKDRQKLDKAEGVGDGYVAPVDIPVYESATGTRLEESVPVYVADQRYTADRLRPYTW